MQRERGIFPPSPLRIEHLKVFAMEGVTMQTLYREQRHKCGEFLDIDLFPVFRHARKGKRKRKAKPASKTQAAYNHQCRVKHLQRIVMRNFKQGEALFYNLSYNNSFVPLDAADAKRQLSNFIKRLRRYRRRKGLPELKYIVTTEQGARSGRFHHHLIINCADMPIADLDNLWGRGYCFSSLVIFDNGGAAGLAAYFCKKKKSADKAADKEEENEADETELDDINIGNAWSRSHNLVEPEETKRDGAISRKKAFELFCLGDDACAEWERLYPDYYLCYAHPLLNEVNGGIYISVRMRRKPQKKSKQKTKSRGAAK